MRSTISVHLALLITSSDASRASNTIKVPAKVAQQNSSQMQKGPASTLNEMPGVSRPKNMTI